MLTDEETELLIELWQGQENLYNVNMNEYFDRTLAKESHIFISQELNKPEWTEEVVKRKLRSLRTSYTRELNELRRREAERAPGEPVKKPRWKWFHLMDPFLRPYCSSRKDVASSNRTDSRDPSASDTDTLTQDAADGDGAAVEDAEMELLYRHHLQTAQPPDPDDVNGDGDDDLAGDDDNNNDYQSSHSASGASTPASVGAVSSMQPRRGRRRQQIADLRNFRDVLSTSSSVSRSRTRSGGGGGGGGGGGDLSRSDAVHRGKRKRCAGSDVLELLAEIAATQDRSPNAEFGSYVATELDKLDERQQRRARFEIHQVLFEIQEEGV